ncbi:MAG: hypothetical protein K0Q79_1843 [Flavipsychrobacter sp.]|jgi:hypothetical protein|nr:hypothetical protein [Flavipsychrobacter sp.]
MIRKILTGFLLVLSCVFAFYSCKKVSNSTVDATRNYFPLQFGKYVTYAVDSTYYYGGAYDTARTVETRCQLKYAVTDTYTYKKKLNYIMDVYYRPYEGADWVPQRVILVQPTHDGLLYSQDGTQYIKLMFPVKEGFSWKGNVFAQVQDTLFSYLKNWDYTYQNYDHVYFNGFVSFDNTVTVMQNDENVNYQEVDSLPHGYKTYAKEVYAYNVGMIYKEWTHYTWSAPYPQSRNGYSVIMRAIDHN